MEKQNEERLMTLEQVRVYLNLGRSQIYQMARNGELPVMKLSERALRVKTSDLDKWLEERRLKTLNN